MTNAKRKPTARIAGIIRAAEVACDGDKDKTLLWLATKIAWLQEFKQLSGAMTDVAAIATASKMTIDEVTKILGKMADDTITGARAGTSLSRILKLAEKEAEDVRPGIMRRLLSRFLLGNERRD